MPDAKKTDVGCHPTPLEAAALSFALGIVNDVVVGVEHLVKVVTVLDRRNTQVGSFVEFDRAEILKTDTRHKRKIFDSIGGHMHGGSIEFGVLVFVDDGYLSGLEFFSYGDAVGVDWPGENKDFELYVCTEELS